MLLWFGIRGDNMPGKFFRLVLVLVAVVALGVFVAPKRAYAATRTWDCNNASTSWTTAANWSGGAVPTSSDDVVIGNCANSGNPGDWPTLAADTTINSLTINGRSSTTNTRGGCLTINNNVTLTINGNLAINGSTGGTTFTTCATDTTATGIDADAGSGSLIVGGNMTLTNQSGGSENPIISMSSGTISVAGNWTMGSNGTFTAGTSTVTFNGAGAQSIGGSTTTFNNLTINKSSGTATLGVNTSVAGNLNVSAGTLDLSTFTANRTAAGGTLTVSNGATLKIGGTNTVPTNYNTHSIDATSTIEYAGSNQNVVVLNSSQNYGNLVTSGTGTKTLLGAITVRGALTIGSSTTLDVSASNFALNVGGNWTNNGSFTQRSGTVTFNGTPAAQTIGGSNSTSFSGLTINNSGGSVTLSTAATVTGVLTLTSDLTASATLTQSGTCGGDGVTTGAGDVVGTVSRSDQGASAKCFGNSLNQISFSSGVPSGSVTVRLTKSAPGGFNGSVVQRYYTISSNSWSGASATLQLRYKTGELSGITENTLVLYKYPTGGTKYIEQGGTVNTSSHFVNLNGVSSFSDWAFAASGTPTAVGLNTFRAKLTPKDKVRVKWSTGSELNILEFNLYRQTAGSKKWVKVNTAPIPATNPGKVFGADYTFTDKNVQAGKTYRYKLEVVGTTEPSQWSDIIKVTVP